MRTAQGASAALTVAVVFTLLSVVPHAGAQGKLEPHYRPLKPDGAGPFPTVMLLPGCGGVRPAQVKSAEDLKAQGYFIVMVDFVAARGLQTICGKAGQYLKEIALQDIRDTVTHLKAQPFVDPSAIAALGWSTGGGAAIYALAATGSPPSSVILRSSPDLLLTNAIAAARSSRSRSNYNV